MVYKIMIIVVLVLHNIEDFKFTKFSFHFICLYSQYFYYKVTVAVILLSVGLFECLFYILKVRQTIFASLNNFSF